MQLTHDELSAICRLNIDGGFLSLITNSVMPDGHPAGVQVLMWYWAKWFGTEEWVVRLPFLLMGIACIPLMARVAALWWNRTAALFSAILMACLQNNIYYSVLARPYVVGLFFMLILLCFWTQIAINNSKRWIDGIAFSISAVCCALCHQFSMLTAGLTALAGFCIIDKSIIKRYFVYCTASILLWLPHLPITLYQLTELKGLNWLLKPNWDFGFEYLSYLAHFSLIAGFCILLVLFFTSEKRIINLRKFILAIVLWALPLIIGVVYSRLVSPIIQFSCLIFSLPFLLLAMCACMKNNSNLKNCVALVCLAVCLTATFFNRQPKTTLPQVFETSFVETCQLTDQFGENNVMVWLAISPQMTHYYELKYNRTINNRYFDNASDYDLYQLLNESKCRYIITAGTQPNSLQLIEQIYPYQIKRIDMQRTSLFVLSTDSTSASITPKEHIVAADSILFNPNDDFTLLLDTNLLNITTNRATHIIAKVNSTVNNNTSGEAPLLVMETLKNGKKVDYQSIAINNNPQFGQTAYLRRDLSEIVKRNNFKGYQLKIYLWNPSHTNNFAPNYFQLSTKTGNPLEFSIVERL